MSMSNVDKQYKYCDDQMYFVFKGICSSKYNLFMVNEGDGLVLFNGTSASIETTGAQYQNGNYLLGIKKESRPINFDVAANGLSKLQVEQLLKWLTVGEIGELSFYHSPEWGYDVVIEDVADPVIYIDDDGYVFTSKLKFKTIGSYYAHNLYGKELVIKSNESSTALSYGISWTDDLLEDSDEFISISANIPSNIDSYIIEYRGQTNTFLYNNQLLQAANNGLTNVQISTSASLLDHPLVRFDSPFAPFQYDKNSKEQEQFILDALISYPGIQIYKLTIPTITEWHKYTVKTAQQIALTPLKAQDTDGDDTYNPKLVEDTAIITLTKVQIDPNGLPLLGVSGNVVYVFLTGNAPSYFSVEFTKPDPTTYDEVEMDTQTSSGDNTGKTSTADASEAQVINVEEESTTGTDEEPDPIWVIACKQVAITKPADVAATFHHHAFNNIIMR